MVYVSPKQQEKTMKNRAAHANPRRNSCLGGMFLNLVFVFLVAFPSPLLDVFVGRAFLNKFGVARAYVLVTGFLTPQGQRNDKGGRMGEHMRRMRRSPEASVATWKGLPHEGRSGLRPAQKNREDTRSPTIAPADSKRVHATCTLDASLLRHYLCFSSSVAIYAQVTSPCHRHLQVHSLPRTSGR